MNIQRIARWHLLYGLAFGLAGLMLGIYMAATRNHGQHVTHAHVLLLGFVVSMLYAVVYRLWLGASSLRLALAQTVLHAAGALSLVIGLFLLYGGVVPESRLGPLLGAGSIAALLGLVLLAVQVLLQGEPLAARLQGTMVATEPLGTST